MFTATSLPMTCAQTMVSASDCVGFTLPGMIELPGSFSGIVISPRPERGPEASQRTSLAILLRAAATVFSAPCANTAASLAAMASNLLGAVTKGSPSAPRACAATRTANSGWALRPVPTAVPPRASSCRWGSADSRCATPWSSWATQPEISWPRVRGVASCRWVRPIFTTSSKARALACSASRSFRSAGMTRSRKAFTAATWIAVGKASFD